MTHELPKLPYAYDALEPFIDEKTMLIHHTKHHQAYIDKLVAAIKGTEWEPREVDDILRHFGRIPESIKAAVRNHGGGHSNHSLFWTGMGPNKGGQPHGKLAEVIVKRFGSFDKFKEEFSAAALNRFGSGWAWLVLSGNELEIMSTPNQDSPIMEGKKPLLGLDVWEHAYYLKHQNKRADYIASWWNVVNWDEVSRRFDNAMK